MKFGISMFVTDQSAPVTDIAQAVEDRGFDSFWISEHSHMPLREPHPFTGFQPRVYGAMLDPFAALGAAAIVTSKILLGTAVCLPAQRDPINCAKSVASIDHLSNGRFQFGIGAGWNIAEMEDHGTDPSTRFRRMRESVEAMRVLWRDEVASYQGRHVQFDEAHMWPKPIQKPGPPVLIAGSGPNVLKRVVAYGDGWLPVVPPEANEEMRGRVTPMPEFRRLMPELRAMASDAGRPPPQVSVMGAQPTEENLGTLSELGVDRLIVSVSPSDHDTVLRELDAYTQTISQSGGQI